MYNPKENRSRFGLQFKSLRFFVYGIFFAISLWAYPVKAEFPCYQFDQELPKLFSEGYGLLASATGPKGSAILILLDRHGDYVILGVDDKKHACEIMTGDSWRFFKGENV